MQVANGPMNQLVDKGKGLMLWATPMVGAAASGFEVGFCRDGNCHNPFDLEVALVLRVVGDLLWLLISQSHFPHV